MSHAGAQHLSVRNLVSNYEKQRPIIKKGNRRLTAHLKNLQRPSTDAEVEDGTLFFFRIKKKGEILQSFFLCFGMSLSVVQLQEGVCEGV
jgi:hypothetical protein